MIVRACEQFMRCRRSFACSPSYCGVVRFIQNFIKTSSRCALLDLDACELHVAASLLALFSSCSSADRKSRRFPVQGPAAAADVAEHLPCRKGERGEPRCRSAHRLASPPGPAALRAIVCASLVSEDHRWQECLKVAAAPQSRFLFAKGGIFR